ncbi:MAG: hypothetical protein GY940_23770 [bacterium]|nr:hypothetical protein [bacterium]
MKTKKFNKKLVLHKETVTNLDENLLTKTKAGIQTRPPKCLAKSAEYTNCPRCPVSYFETCFPCEEPTFEGPTCVN